MQDLLGEVHDLDVLWATALRVYTFPNPESKSEWRDKIAAERRQRVEKYRARMVGPDALWQTWRESLPSGKDVEKVAEKRVGLWASLLDPDVKHSSHVERLALQLFDGLPPKNTLQLDAHKILRIAAMLHNIGRSDGEREIRKSLVPADPQDVSAFRDWI